MPKRTDPQRVAAFQLQMALNELEFDLHDAVMWRKHIPQDWCEVHKDRSHKKVKVTAQLDEISVKYLKSLGPGYQARINKIVRAWVNARAAKMVRDEAMAVRMIEEANHQRGGPFEAEPSEY